MAKFDLATIEKVDALQVFTGGGIDPILEAITNEVKSYVPDTSTAAGRKDIASLAYKVSQSKVLLDAAGKSLVAEWKSNSSLVDASRKNARDTLDALRNEARRPLTEWEESEKARVAAEKLASEIEQAQIEAISENDLFDRQREIERKEAAIALAEEKRLAKEAEELAEKNRLEREEIIRKEAKEQAEREAEEEKTRLIKEAQDAIDRAEREKKEADITAEIERREAAEKEERLRAEAEVEKARAIKAERERIEAEQEAERIATEKRENDRKHKAKINNAIVAALVKEVGITEAVAKKVVSAIAKLEVPYIKINY